MVNKEATTESSIDRSAERLMPKGMAGDVFKFRWETIKRVACPALCLTLFLAYSVLRIINLQAIQEVRQFPDTPVYTGIASRSLLDFRFWIGERPWTTPLFYKLLRNDPPSIAVFQLALSTICWGLLALCAARAVRISWLKPIAFGIILLFSLSTEIILWDGVMLADSISLSLTALFIASWLWVLEDWQRFKVAAMALVAFSWAFTKDTNAWVVLVIAAILISGVASRRIQGRYALLACVFAVIFAMNDVTANRAHRWVVAFMNNVGMRILPSPERTAYFAELGMPVTPALMQRREKKAWSDNWAFFKDPALQQFRDWLYARGKSSYIRFLLSHLAVTIQEPVRHSDELLSSELRNYAPANFASILNKPLAEVVYFKRWAVLWTWAAGIAVGFVFGLKLWTRNVAFLVPLALIILVYPQAVIAWHGDPNEIGRHGLEAAVNLRLGLWLLLLFAADMMFGSIIKSRL
jgi:hypothetical protein